MEEQQCREEQCVGEQRRRGLKLERGFMALAGLAMALAMPPYGLWLLAWVAVVPLWCWTIAAPQLDWRRRWVNGAVWAALYEGVTTHWLWDLHPLTWMGIAWGPSVAIALFAWLAVVVWRMASVVLWTTLAARLARGRSPWLRVLVGVALWCAVDWLWSCGPLYWANFALSQSPHNLMILQLGRLGGPTAVTAAIVAVNGLLAEAGVQWGEPGRAPRMTMGRLGRVALALFVGLHGLGGWLYGGALASLEAESRRGGIGNQGPLLKIGLVQGNVATREKLSAAGIALAVERYGEGFRALAAQGADGVLLPEGALPFVWSEWRGRLGKPLLTAMADYPETRLWLGTLAWSGQGESQGLSQSLLSLDPRGEVMGRYDKVKLVPLGEYVPGDGLLQGLLQALGVGRLSSLPVGMVPGDSSQVFESGLAGSEWTGSEPGQAKLARAGAMICYEPAFSGVMRRQVAAGAGWLMTSSNLDPYDEQLMAQAEALDVMRAVEGDRWGVRATNTGFSGVVDPLGRVVWRSNAGEVVSYLAEIDVRDSRTLFVQWGDWLVWALVAGAGVGLCWRR